MGFLSPKKESFRFKRIIAVALLLTIFDGFIYGLPVFGLFISSAVFLASAIASLIFLFVDKNFFKALCGEMPDLLVGRCVHHWDV